LLSLANFDTGLSRVLVTEIPLSRMTVALAAMLDPDYALLPVPITSTITEIACSSIGARTTYVENLISTHF
jgi:hypothetical protein